MRSFKNILIFSFLLLFSVVQAGRINLTKEEEQWLTKHKTIRIAPDPDFPPIEFFNNNGKYSGIAADYMKIIEKELGINFQVVRCNSWEEVLEKAKNREVDLLPAAGQSPQRAKYLNYSSFYLKFQGIIITKKDSKINSLKQLSGKDVAIVSGYIWQELVSINNPEINIKPADNILDALIDVSMCSVDAMIATMPIALYYIEKQGILNLRIAGKTNYYTNLCVQTRKDWLILNSIIEKALKNIPDNEKKKILQKWVPLKQKSFFENKLFWIIISGLSLIFIISLFVFLWNRVLRKQINKKTEELREDIAKRKIIEEKLKDTLILLETTLNAIPDIIGIQDDKYRIIRYNAAGYKVLNKKLEDVKGKKCYELINRDRECEICATSKVYKSKKPEHVIRYEKYLNAWLDVRAYPVFDEKGNIVKIVEHLRDITEQRLVEKALKESEKQYRELLENVPIGIVILTSGKLKYINKTGRNIMQVDTEDNVLDINTIDFVYDDFKKLVKKRIENILKTGKIQRLIEEKYVTYKGKVFDVESVSMPVIFNGEKSILVLFNDISERKKNEKEIYDKNKYLQIINELSDKLRFTLDLKSVAKESVKAMMEFSNSPSVALFLVNKETDCLDAIYTNGFSEESQRAAKHLPLKGSLTGITIKEKRIVTSKEIEEDNRLEPEVKKSLLGENLKSVISIPLLYKDEILGAINLIFKEMPDLKVSDYKTLSGISSAIAMSLKNALYVSEIKEEMEMRKKAEEKLKEYSEKLEKMVKDRTSELEEKNKKLQHFNDLFVNREFRIKELRDKVNELKKKIEEKD